METQEDFDDTVAFIEKAQFLTVHIFPYSSRKGTEASKMSGQISQDEKHRRLHVLEESAHASRLNVLRAELQSDKTKQVLFETYDGKYAYGHTDNFLEVAVMSDCDLKSKISALEALSQPILRRKNERRAY